jgi:hypothetical protein
MEYKLTTVKFGYQEEQVFKINWGSGAGWWQGHEFIALIISNVCKKILEEGTGYPSILYSRACQKQGLNPMEEHFDLWASCEKEWHEMLKKMIWAFEQVADEDFEFELHKNPEYKTKFDEGFELFQEFFLCLWD